MIFQYFFTVRNYDKDVGDARCYRFFHHVLYHRLIDNGHHLLGLRFGSRKKPRAETGSRDNTFFDGGLSHFQDQTISGLITTAPIFFIAAVSELNIRSPSYVPMMAPPE